MLVFISSKQHAVEFYFLRLGKILLVYESQGYNPLLSTQMNYTVLPIMKCFTQVTKNLWYNITNRQSFNTGKTKKYLVEGTSCVAASYYAMGYDYGTCCELPRPETYWNQSTVQRTQAQCRE